MSDSVSVQLDVTQEAKEQVRELIKGQKPGTAVRVYLQAGGGGGGCGSGGCGSGGGGGCNCGGGGGGAGPAFGMAFDRPRNGDQVIAVDGFQIVVDDLSAALLNGATIDYVQDLNASGFKITAPTSAAPDAGHEGGGCGCGSGGCGCG